MITSARPVINSRLRPVRQGLGIAILAMFVLVGCSRQIKIPATVPVTGVVLMDGKPAAGVRVTFHPQFHIGATKFLPQGETGENGRFELSTGLPSNGAPPGKYIVTFERPEIQSPESSNYIDTEIDGFSGKYSDPSQSRWTVTIARGEPVVLVPFELK